MTQLDYQSQDTWKADTSWQSPIDLNLKTLIPQKLTQQPLAITFPSKQDINEQPSASGMQFLATGELKFKGQTYQLQRFHFHDGSEHLFDGQRLSCELHFVFSGPNKETLVLAVLCALDPTKTNRQIADIFAGKCNDQELANLIPTKLAYVTYTGTLTTPPLKSGVTWVVLTTALEISPVSAAAIKNAFANNHRQVQPLNKRPINWFC